MKTYLKISLFLFIVACSKNDDSNEIPKNQTNCPFNDLRLSAFSSDENITVTASTSRPDRSVNIFT